MARDPWRRSAAGWEKDLERRPFWTVTKAVVAVILTVLVLIALVFGITTGFSYWWGQGNAVQQKNSTQNFLAAQQEFHLDQNAVTLDVQKIATDKANLAQFQQAHPDWSGNGTPYDPDAQQYGNLQVTLQGDQRDCLNHIQDYDTAAQSFLTEDWRGADLPPTLDPKQCD